MQKDKLFPLSKINSLVVLITLNLIGIPVYANNDIQAANNNTNITTKNNVPVVNIATPNKTGLSHNQYYRYNVNQAGAILNNAKTNSHSTILNQVLSANPNLSHSLSATTILNEVISNNPSTLLGKQEILGQKANLILANPNGITCDGCGFINTNQASLVVGKPYISREYLQSFDTRNTNKLVINNNGITTDNILTLIAPSIYSSGLIKANDIKIVTGHNDVTPTAIVIRTQNHFARTNVDSYFLGGMQAGKITLINTNAGSGVNIRGNYNATNELSINSEGNVYIKASKLNTNKLNIEVNNLSTEAEIVKSSSESKDKDNYWWWGGAKDAGDKNTSSKVTQTELVGKNITIRTRQNSELNATKITADTLDIEGNNIILGNQISSTSHERYNNRWHFSWFNNQTIKNSQEKVISTEIHTTNKTSLIAGQNITLVASKINSDGNLVLTAQNNITLKGQIEKKDYSDSGSVKNETAALKTGFWNNINTEDKVIQSELYAKKNIGLDSKNDINLIGAKINAKQDIIISTPNNININVAKGNIFDKKREHFDFWGGIGGGYGKDNSSNKETIFSSDIYSGDDLLLLGEKNINISGSKVIGKNNSLVKTPKGKITIDSAIVFDKNNIRQRQGTLLDITTSSENSHSYTSTTKGSEVKSDVNLQVIGFNGIKISGSILKSAGELGLHSFKDIIITSSEEKTTTKKHTTEFSIKSEAGVKDHDTLAVEANSSLVHTTINESSQKIKQNGSQILGENIAIETKKDVVIASSTLKSKSDTTIKSNNLSVTTNADSSDIKRNTTTLSVGIKVYTGLEKTGLGFSGGTGLKKQNIQDSTANSSEISAGKDLVIDTKEKVKNIGAKYQVGGKTEIIAAQIENQASKNSHSEDTKENNLALGLDANLQYGHIVKPIADTIRKAQKSEITPTSIINTTNNILKTLNKNMKPNVGPELGVSVTNSTSSSNTTTANVTKFTTNSLEEKSKKIQDQATIYNANNDIKLETNSYKNTAVANITTEKSEVTSGKGSLRVYTSTGKDLNAEIKGEGKNEKINSHKSDAIVGSISSTQGNVTIHTKNDIDLEATNVNALNGKIELQSENGNVNITHATSTIEENNTSYNANAGLKAGILPDTKNFGGSLGGGYTNNQNTSSTSTTSTIIANSTSIKAKENINLIGTSISTNSDHGKTELQAGKDISFKQATDSHSTSSNNYNGSININQGNGKTDKNSFANINGTYETKKSESTTAKAGEISGSQDVTLNANQNIHLEGTKIGTQDQTVNNIAIHSGGNTIISAATSSSAEHNVSVSAGVIGGGSKTDSDEKQGLSLDITPSLHVEYVDKKANEQAGGILQASGSLNITSEGKKGIETQGTKITSSETHLTATQGEIKLKSAENTEKHTEIKVGINTNIGRSHSETKPKDENTKSKVTHTEKSLLDVDLKVNIGDSVKHSNTAITTTGTTKLNSQTGITLAGATVNANNIEVKTKGDVNIESKQDKEHLTDLELKVYRQSNDDPEANILSQTNKLLNSTKPDKPAKISANKTNNSKLINKNQSVATNENSNVKLTKVTTSNYSLPNNSSLNTTQVSSINTTLNNQINAISNQGNNPIEKQSISYLEKQFNKYYSSVASNGNNNVTLTSVKTNNYTLQNNNIPKGSGSFLSQLKDLFPAKTLQPSTNQSWNNGITTTLGVQTSLETRLKVIDKNEVNVQSALSAKNQLDLQAKNLNLTAAKIEANSYHLNTEHTNMKNLDENHLNIDIGLKGSSYFAGMLTQAIDGIKNDNILPITLVTEHHSGTLQSYIGQPSKATKETEKEKIGK